MGNRKSLILERENPLWAAFSKRSAKSVQLQRSRIPIGAAVGYFGIHTVAVHLRSHGIGRPKTPTVATTVMSGMSRIMKGTHPTDAETQNQIR
jgi:hypothetical protein